MHHTQRRRQVSMIRRLKRQWWGAALGLLLLLAIEGHGQNDPNLIAVRSDIQVDYNGNVVRTYYNRFGGAARVETLGNINQPGGYRGPLPAGFSPPGGQRANQPPQPTPRPVATPRPIARPPGPTIRIVTKWARKVTRTRNGRAYLDWERLPNGRPRIVEMVGYRYSSADGGYRLSGVQGAGDANMRRQGFQMVGYDVSTR